MKQIPPTIVRIVAALILGMLLVLWPDVAVRYVVIAIGLFFLIVGAAIMVTYYRTDPMERNIFPFAALGSVLLGFLLVIAHNWFIGILMYMLGAFLLMAAIHLGVLLMRAHQRLTASLWLFVLPAILLASGVVVLVKPFAVATIPFIILGISCIFYALMDLFTYIAYVRRWSKGE